MSKPNMSKPATTQPVVHATVIQPVKDRKPGFPTAATIVVVSSANPKRPGTKAAAKWPLYAGAKTVGDVVRAFVAAGYAKRRAMSAMRWDEARGFIRVELPATK